MRSITLGVMLFAAATCLAQRDSINSKKVDQYLGVQANQLLRQLFNFGGTATVVANPYLLNYSLNSKKTGWGFNVGIGYTVDNSTQTTVNTTNDSQSSNFSFRIGVERKTFLSKKWMLSYGFDLLSDKSNITSTSKSQFQSNINETDISSTTKDSGFGPRFTLNYFITSKIILGTEVTYYYKAINISQNTTNTSTGPQGGGTSSSSTNQDLKQFHFTVPASLFLTLRF